MMDTIRARTRSRHRKDGAAVGAINLEDATLREAAISAALII
jgi:hypothetical protein